MDWVNDIGSLFKVLREIAQYTNDSGIKAVLTDGVPQLDANNFDNWNGGTTHYTLTIGVPAYAYAAAEEELETIENKILEKIKKLQRAETNDFIDTVVISVNPQNAERVVPLSDTPFWQPGHFRLFVSHLSTDKLRAKTLKTYLAKKAVSCFIAHEDIEPTREWMVEIEKALFSMEGLIALLTDRFHDSKWTDQEVGIALGRGVLVVPVGVGLDPYGLMGKYQAVSAKDRTIKEVCSAIVKSILANSRTRIRLLECVVEQLLSATDLVRAGSLLEVLELASDIPADQLLRLRDHAASNTLVDTTEPLLRRINDLLESRGYSKVTPKKAIDQWGDYDIPF